MEHSGVKEISKIHTVGPSFANIRFSLIVLFKTLSQVVSNLENPLWNFTCTSHFIHAT
jgi:hypothetical protein